MWGRVLEPRAPPGWPEGPTGEPQALRAPSTASAGLCVSGRSPTGSFWEGVWGNRQPLSTMTAQFQAPGTAWTAHGRTVTLSGEPGLQRGWADRSFH